MSTKHIELLDGNDVHYPKTDTDMVMVGSNGNLTQKLSTIDSAISALQAGGGSSTTITAEDEYDIACQKRLELMLSKWTPVGSIDYYSSGKKTFVSGTEYTGMPYGTSRELNKYVGYNVGMRAFLSAVKNPYSLLYTECVTTQSTAKKSAWGIEYKSASSIMHGCYYTSQCTCFAFFVVGLPDYHLVHNYNYLIAKGYLKSKGNVDLKKIRKWDMISWYGHCMLCTDVQRNSNGKVTSITICDSYPPTARVLTYVDSTGNENLKCSTTNKYFKNVYMLGAKPEDGTHTILFRAANLQNLSREYEDLTDYNADKPIIPFGGDYTTYRKDDLIAFAIKDRGAYTHIEIQKDGEYSASPTVSKIALPVDTSNHYVVISSNNASYLSVYNSAGGNIPSGLYKARLVTLNDSGTITATSNTWCYFEVVGVTIKSSSYSNGVLTLSFESDNLWNIGGTLVNKAQNAWFVDVCKADGYPSVHYCLNGEERARGKVSIDVADVAAQQDYNTTDIDHVRVVFRGEYGSVESEHKLLS